MNQEYFGGFGGFEDNPNPLGIDLDFSPQALAGDLLQWTQENSGYLMGAGLFGLDVALRKDLVPGVAQQESEVNYHLLFNALLYFVLPAIMGAGNARRAGAELRGRINSITQSMGQLKEAHGQTGLMEAKKREDIEARLKQLDAMRKRTEEAFGGGAIIREFFEGAWATEVSVYAISNTGRILREYNAAGDFASQTALAIEGMIGILVASYFVKLAWNTQGPGGSIGDKERKAELFYKQTGN